MTNVKQVGILTSASFVCCRHEVHNFSVMSALIRDPANKNSPVCFCVNGFCCVGLGLGLGLGLERGLRLGLGLAGVGLDNRFGVVTVEL